MARGISSRLSSSPAAGGPTAGAHREAKGASICHGTAGNGYGLYQPVKENTCVTTGPKDFSKPPTLTSGEDASCLVVETVFQSIKRQGNPDRLATAAAARASAEGLGKHARHCRRSRGPCSVQGAGAALVLENVLDPASAAVESVRRRRFR